MPEFFYLLINYPVLIAAAIIFYAALALWSHSRTAWVATAAWVVYLGYELGMNAGVLCSGDECIKRSPLYFGYPLLAFLSAVALIQVYAHVRDNSIKARLGRGIHQPRTLAAASSSDQVSTVALAWDAFMRALAETSELRRSGLNARGRITYLRVAAAFDWAKAPPDEAHPPRARLQSDVRARRPSTAAFADSHR